MDILIWVVTSPLWLVAGGLWLIERALPKDEPQWP